MNVLRGIDERAYSIFPNDDVALLGRYGRVECSFWRVYVEHGCARRIVLQLGENWVRVWNTCALGLGEGDTAMGDGNTFTSGSLDDGGRVRHECIQAWAHFCVRDLEVEEE